MESKDKVIFIQHLEKMKDLHFTNADSLSELKRLAVILAALLPNEMPYSANRIAISNEIKSLTDNLNKYKRNDILRDTFVKNRENLLHYFNRILFIFNS